MNGENLYEQLRAALDRARELEDRNHDLTMMNDGLALAYELVYRQREQAEAEVERLQALLAGNKATGDATKGPSDGE